MKIRASMLKKQAQVKISTKFGEFETLAYASNAEEKMPHMVLFNPATNFSEVVNVRIHSECMTGDVFHSYRCECGEQLDAAMQYIQSNNGVLIYLRQEGRGIGLINKLHAYVKQDEGYNTAEANKILGFGYDDRTYEDAISILEDLGISSVNLLTNNPSKLSAFDDSSILISIRIPLEIIPREENRNYLKTKREFFNHKLTREH